MSEIVGSRIIDRIMAGTYQHPEVEENLYADRDATSIELKTVEEGVVPDGHEGMIVSVAVSNEVNQRITLFIERDGKQVYDNGLHCAGLSGILDTGTEVRGVNDEVFLGIRLKEKGKWKLQFKASGGTPNVNWRLRVRHFKKG